jgi:hypothetical protein
MVAAISADSRPALLTTKTRQRDKAGRRHLLRRLDAAQMAESTKQRAIPSSPNIIAQSELNIFTWIE